MKWKCINDWFGYCSGEPDGAANARMEERATKVNGVDTIVKINMGMGATCSLNPKTCGKQQGFNQVMEDDLLKQAQAKIKEPVIKTTIVINKKTKADKGIQEELL
jgi:hypothetical protein